MKYLGFLILLLSLSCHTPSELIHIYVENKLDSTIYINAKARGLETTKKLDPKGSDSYFIPRASVNLIEVTISDKPPKKRKKNRK